MIFDFCKENWEEEIKIKISGIGASSLSSQNPQSSRSVGAKKMEAPPVAEPDGGSRRPSFKPRLSSTSLKHVYLYDWWLIRTETFTGYHNLGVGGPISDPHLEPRIFNSAAISKRHGDNVLEAIDGITIKVVGAINRVCTIKNGFSHEVCRHFLCGFPYYWEDYAGADGSIPRANSTPNSSVHKSIDDLPLPLMHDFFLSPSCQVYGVCEVQKSIMKNIKRTCENDHDDAHLVLPPKEGNSQVTSKVSQEHDIPIKNGNSDGQHQVNDTAVVDTKRSCGRPSKKRRKSRVITEVIQKEKNFLSSSAIKSPPHSKSVSINEVPLWRQHEETANEKNMPNLNMTSTGSQEHEIPIKNSNIDGQHQINDMVVVDTKRSRGRPSKNTSNGFVITQVIQKEENFLSSSVIKSPQHSNLVSISEIPLRRQHEETANEENMPNLNLKARKAATLRKHSTSSRLGTKGSQREKDTILSATEKCQGSVDGKSVSVACTTTRKLSLRSRSVDMYIG